LNSVIKIANILKHFFHPFQAVSTNCCLNSGSEKSLRNVDETAAPSPGDAVNDGTQVPLTDCCELDSVEATT
jgi:hypothetical protein